MLNIVKAWSGKIRSPRQKCLATASAAAGAAALGALFDDPAVQVAVGANAFSALQGLGGQLWNSIRSVLNSIVATNADAVMAMPLEEERFRNHFLCRSVSEAVRSIVEDECESAGPRVKRIGELILDDIFSSWADFEDGDAQPLTDNQLTALFSLEPTKIEASAATSTFWEKNLRRLARDGGGLATMNEDEEWCRENNENPAVKVLASAISQKLYGRVRDLLVNDAATGGQAFAALQFKLLTEIIRLSHRVLDDTETMKQLVDVTGNAVKAMRSRLKSLDTSTSRQADAILRQVLEVHHNALMIGLDVSELSQQMDRMEAKLQQLLTPRRPNDVLPLNEWIEGRHDSGTLLADRVPTSVVRLILDLYQCGSRHFLLVGDIASGKSTTASDVVRTILNSPGGPRATAVLPLGLDFGSRPDIDWSRLTAMASLAEYMAQLGQFEQLEHLILVEDAHTSLTPSFTGYNPIDLNSCNIVITCRSGAESAAEDRLREYWGIEPEVVFLDPSVSAETMIEAAISEVIPERHAAIRRDMHGVFRSFGSNLFMLRLVIAAWNNDQDQVISMDLAYDAVKRELYRVAGAMADGNDTAEDRVKLILVWMLSGLDLKASREILSTYFGLDVPQSNLRRLQQEREIAVADLSDDDFSVLRHPAWGLLALKAIDEHDGLKPERRIIRQRFDAVAIADMPPHCQSKAAREWKASEALIFSVLDSGRATPDELAFTCSGKHISDEFVQAVNVRVDCQEADGVSKKDLAEEITAIVNNLRRVASRDPDQQTVAWSDGLQLTEEAISLREADFGEGLPGDELAGRLYYQLGYYQYLLGRFDEARATFLKSAKSDLALGSVRQVFAGMSKVMEANATLDGGDIDQAEAYVAEAMALIGTDESRFGHQFRGNAEGTTFEISIRRRNVQEAADALERFKEEFDLAGVVSPFGVRDAKLALLDGRFGDADSLCDTVYLDTQHMSYAETRIEASRVKGDCLLAMGCFEEADRIYRGVLPRDLNGPLSFQQQLIVSRLNKIDGTQPSEILGQSILAAAIL